MTFDEWIAQIRDVAHTGDEIATLHFARALRFAPQDKALHERWQDVRAYAACLDLDAEAPDLEWAYHDAVTRQRLVQGEMARRARTAHPDLGRNLNSSCVVQDLLARAYVRDELAKRGRVWLDGGES